VLYLYIFCGNYIFVELTNPCLIPSHQFFLVNGNPKLSSFDCRALIITSIPSSFAPFFSPDGSAHAFLVSNYCLYMHSSCPCDISGHSPSFNLTHRFHHFCCTHSVLNKAKTVNLIFNHVYTILCL